MTERAAGTPADTAERPLVLVDIRSSADGVEALRRALREGERRNGLAQAPGESSPVG
jgi:hypothetical protein